MTRNADRKGERGIITVLVAIGIGIVLLGVAAFAIDVGYMVTTRAQLQNAADAGAVAGARELSRVYTDLGNVDYRTYSLTSADKARVVNATNTFTLKNQAAGKFVSVRDADIAYQKWDPTNGATASAATGVNALSVAARRDALANGAVSTILGRVLGVNTFIARADAGAALSGPRVIPPSPGWGEFPVGISRHWFEVHDSPCGKDSAIQFYPTGSITGCAGWHTFTNWPANANTLRSILNSMQAGTWGSPEIKTDTTQFAFIGGTVASAFTDMQNLFNAKKTAGAYLIRIPVYDSSDCSNPNGWQTIIGYATARVTQVKTAPSKTIEAQVECSVLPVGKGGGRYYGSLVAAPALMQ